jgi:hypothetical protein
MMAVPQPSETIRLLKYAKSGYLISKFPENSRPLFHFMH